MTIANKPEIETFTGLAKQYDHAWWAMCDQLPIASSGKSYNEAIQCMLASIQTYRTYSNGSGYPKIDPLARGNGGLPFELSIAIE